MSPVHHHCFRHMTGTTCCSKHYPAALVQWLTTCGKRIDKPQVGFSTGINNSVISKGDCIHEIVLFNKVFKFKYFHGFSNVYRQLKKVNFDLETQ